MLSRTATQASRLSGCSRAGWSSGSAANSGSPARATLWSFRPCQVSAGVASSEIRADRARDERVVQPRLTGGRSQGFGGKAGSDEAAHDRAYIARGLLYPSGPRPAISTFRRAIRLPSWLASLERYSRRQDFVNPSLPPRVSPHSRASACTELRHEQDVIDRELVPRLAEQGKA